MCMTENEACNSFPCSALFLLGKCYLNMLCIQFFNVLSTLLQILASLSFLNFGFCKSIIVIKLTFQRFAFFGQKLQVKGLNSSRRDVLCKFVFPVFFIIFSKFCVLIKRFKIVDLWVKLLSIFIFLENSENEIRNQTDKKRA